jgi:hypothetical protein
MSGESFVPVDMEPHTARSAMFANGYEPIPLDGKRPLLNGWQNITVNQKAIDGWGSRGNTGMRTAFTPVFDIDVLHEGAARLIEEVVRERLHERGTILVRIGLPPKRAIVLRTNGPFKKIVRTLVDPNGTAHKIEILGDGQQVAVAGTHPDTNAPYTWQGGRSPINTPRAHLPLINEQEAREVLALCVQRLRDELGWTEQLAEVVTLVPQNPDTAPLPLPERLAATEYKGQHGLNDAILAMTADRISSGMPVADVVEECMQFVRGVWDKIQDEHPDKAAWNWNQQRDQITDACYGFIKKECGNQPRIVETLPDWMLKKIRGRQIRSRIWRHRLAQPPKRRQRSTRGAGPRTSWYSSRRSTWRPCRAAVGFLISITCAGSSQSPLEWAVAVNRLIALSRLSCWPRRSHCCVNHPASVAVFGITAATIIWKSFTVASRLSVSDTI